MRVLKFRGYDTFNKEMMQLEDQFPEDYKNFITGKVYPQVKVMQFTGFLDKLGNEVYEDDILLMGNRIKLRVKWMESQFRTGWNINTARNAVVIGNIHEQTELTEVRHATPL